MGRHIPSNNSLTFQRVRVQNVLMVFLFGYDRIIAVPYFQASFPENVSFASGERVSFVLRVT